MRHTSAYCLARRFLFWRTSQFSLHRPYASADVTRLKGTGELKVRAAFWLLNDDAHLLNPELRCPISLQSAEQYHTE